MTGEQILFCVVCWWVACVAIMARANTEMEHHTLASIVSGTIVFMLTPILALYVVSGAVYRVIGISLVKVGLLGVRGATDDDSEN